MADKKKIIIAADHAGIDLKDHLVEFLNGEGFDVTDAGTNSHDSCDYPIYAEKACRSVVAGEHALAILCCGTGIGMSMAANKIKGIRAACCSDVFSAKYTRLHNDANVLCLGARVVGIGLADELVNIFVNTEFEGGKHARRVGLISDIEARG